MSEKYRLITRSDFDGLVCAVLLRELNLIDEINFVHPKDVQDGKIVITENDITTNLPYSPDAYLCFDHHYSETLRNVVKHRNHVIDPEAPSAARVVYEYYGGKQTFPNVSDEMMEAVDKSDSANFSKDDIIDPNGWVLLSFIMDARTGLGRFRDFRVSNYQLMMDLIAYCADHTIEEILDLPDVRERVDLYFKHSSVFKKQLLKCAVKCENVVIINLKDEDIIYSGNRFMIYALFPECNVSIHILWGLKKQNTVFAIGKSILKRDCPTNIGELALRFAGGGHANAGTCQVPHENADEVLELIIETLVGDNKNIK